MAQFVDWDLAAATAGALGKSGPKVSYDEAAEVVTDLRRLTDEAAGHVTSYTGLRSQVAHPPVRVVDRRDWAAVNIAGLREVITPLVSRLSGDKQPGALTDAIGSRLTGVQAGTVLAYLSGRVLGQYEVFSAEPGQLLLIAPNIVEVERKLQADPRDFRLWVCLHEVTHRTQFTAVPWMRGHFLGEVQAFVDASQAGGEHLLERLRRGVATLSDSVRDPESRASVLDIVQTPAQRAVLDRLTALMTLLEGHAEFVMDGVGPEVIPSVEQIRARFNRRRESGNPLEKAIRKLLGIDVKMRQYAEGRKFVHGVVERVGMAGFNKIFDSPLTLPRLDELGDPDAWVARVHGPVPGSAPTA
ncbi:zinc-dependent metalloprotease [Micromonospora sp. NPDC049679]|uniref:zinc-dependent metalloprotease n=1 Tax=Micromonospora sp. NPDC049679 TaxID=3155920 RepID=UPI0033DF236A